MFAKFLVSAVNAIAGLVLVAVVSQGGRAHGAQVDRHFWPTPIFLEDPEASGYLWAWPEYQVLLQARDAQGVYRPAVISDRLATELARLFPLPSGSAIHVVRDATTWGLEIVGGHVLRAENAQLLPAMAQDFVNCLSTLTEVELLEMQMVLSQPRGYVRGLDQGQKDVAAKMMSNYRLNRCQNGVTQVPDLTRSEVKRYLAVLLTGQADSRVWEGDLLVLTSLYHDLLFATDGLWVRATLGAMKAVILGVMGSHPFPLRLDWLGQDFNSFIDFVLLTRENAGLSNAQYVDLAGLCGVSATSQAFSPFPLSQCVAQQRIDLVRLVLGSSSAAYFVKESQ